MPTNLLLRKHFEAATSFCLIGGSVNPRVRQFFSQLRVAAVALLSSLLLLRHTDSFFQAWLPMRILAWVGDR